MTGRVVIEGVSPEVGGGRYPIKRTVGEKVVVEADIFTDGHDLVTARLLHRASSSSSSSSASPDWSETRMVPIGNDRFRAAFTAEELGRAAYTVEAWVDAFRTWARALAKRIEAAQDVRVDLAIGERLVRAAAGRARGDDAAALERHARELARAARESSTSTSTKIPEEIVELMDRYPDRARATRYARELEVVVDPERARFGAWYEMFPRSASPEPGRHGTFRDVEARLAYVAGMGFDVLYLPPIHPIGRTHRKGKNNAPAAAPGDPGSPWAIGSAEGGHKAIHPQLGTLDDFRRLVARARADYGIEVALDIAFQASPDHPYVREHPEWFRRRPDGTIQYAENPPKTYEDIYSFDFDSDFGSEAALALVAELISVVRFWIAQGVRVFRVDNPHTKPFAFWERLIAGVKREFPETIFLSEAFTRPKVMYALAKLGFTQSYTYFAWRNTAGELRAYFTELAETGVREFFRPNLWPNTPDILPEYLQHGGRAAFAARLVLAATLGATYGVYGPAFELCVGRAVAPGKEEYLDSEKYEVKHWDLDHPDSLRDLIARVNRIRCENAALHADRGLRFHAVENPQLLAYSKTTEDGSNGVLVVVNLDPHHRQSGWLDLDLDALGIERGSAFQAHDLLGDSRFLWQGPRNFVELDPGSLPAHIFRLRHRVRTEHDFDYFL